MNEPNKELVKKLQRLLKSVPKNSTTRIKILDTMSIDLIRQIIKKNPPDKTLITIDEILYDFLIGEVTDMAKEKDKKMDLSSFEVAFKNKEIPELKEVTSKSCNPYVTHECICGNHTPAVGFRNPENGRNYIISCNPALIIGEVVMVIKKSI